MQRKKKKVREKEELNTQQRKNNIENNITLY
jgi:hypothetical protein